MDLQALEKKIGVVFKTPGLLAQALTHRSYQNEHRLHKQKSNERLEFLGDAVLELVVTEFVMAVYGDRHEGELTQIRSRLVCNETLSKVGESLDLYDNLSLSRGQMSHDVLQTKRRLTACAYEAIVGAVYADFGYKAAQRFIDRTLLSMEKKILSEKPNAKTQLLQLVQKNIRQAPTYEVLQERDDVPEDRFLVGVFIGGTMVAQATGPTKKLASEAAAAEALNTNNWD